MNELLSEFLSANGYNESLKSCPGPSTDENKLAKFKMFKQRTMKRRKSRKTPKLSFEINLGENDVPISRSVFVVKSAKKVKKKESETKKTVPKDFIAHIVKLGFDAKDAERLYESKDDWLGMAVGGKVLCVERGCKFLVPLSSDALFEHCRTVHNWRDYPCPRENCRYVAYSAYSFNLHLSRFHSPYTKHNGNIHSCSRPGCKAAFEANSNLMKHEKIHDNDVFRCIFCPYVNADLSTFGRHQRVHFNARDYVCNVCHMTFTSQSYLNKHSKEVHDRDHETTTNCPLCDKVGDKIKIEFHLRHKHKVAGMQWDEKLNQFIVPKQVKKNKNTVECL